MTPQHVTAMYQELETLQIQLDPVPELGPEYLKEKLLECRQKQNRISEMAVRCNQAYSQLRQAVRAQEAVVRLSTQDQFQKERDNLMALVDQRDAVKFLLEAIHVRRSNLARTSSDIRLLDSVIKEGRYTGGDQAPAKDKKPAPPTDPEVEEFYEAVPVDPLVDAETHAEAPLDVSAIVQADAAETEQRTPTGPVDKRKISKEALARDQEQMEKTYGLSSLDDEIEAFLKSPPETAVGENR